MELQDNIYPCSSLLKKIPFLDFPLSKLKTCEASRNTIAKLAKLSSNKRRIQHEMLNNLELKKMVSHTF